MVSARLLVRSCTVALHLGLLTGVRVVDDVETAEQDLSACSQDFAPLVRAISAQDIFRPLVQGTYKLRNKLLGSYLAIDANGAPYFSVNPSDNSFEWQIAGTQPPQYTLLNRGIKQFMDSNEEGVTFAEEARMVDAHLDADGIHYQIAVGGKILQVLSDKSITLRPPAAEVSMTLYDQSGMADKVDPSGALWSLEWEEKCMHGTCHRTQGGEYGRQWEVAQGFQFFSPTAGLDGTQFAWRDLCVDMKRDCSESYSAWRSALVMDGRMSENSKYKVTETKVRSVCDMPITFLKSIAQTENIIRAAVSRTDHSSTCRRQTFKESSTSFYQALESFCLKSCLDVVHTAAKSLDCKTGQNYTEFFEGVFVQDECTDVPAPTVEALLDYSMKSRCWTWSPPSPLWFYNDKGPDRVKDTPPTCSAREGRRKDVSRDGTCPQGTTCRCPRRAMGGVKTTSMIRGDHVIFGEDGFATLPSVIARRIQSGLNLNWKIEVIKATGALPSLPSLPALASSLIKSTYSPISQVMMGIALVKYAMPVLKESCADTVACWPAKARKTRVKGTKRACRLGKSAKNSGSAVWFMPPPGLKLTHRKWSIFARCKVAACTKDEVLTQTVGFGRSASDRGYTGRPNVYNCQPLNFEDMSAFQKGRMLNELGKTIEGEYDISALQKQYPSP